jgi:hypothetical protein
MYKFAWQTFPYGKISGFDPDMGNQMQRQDLFAQFERCHKEERINGTF